MAERNCKKCFHYKACKEIASHSGYGDIYYTENQCKNFISADDVVEVVRCKDCKHFTKEMIYDSLVSICKSAQGMVDPSPDFYCSYGERKGERYAIHRCGCAAE